MLLLANMTLFFFILPGKAFSQENFYRNQGLVFVLHPYIGSLIDRVENEYYNIFDFDGFYDAQIYLPDDSLFMAEVVIVYQKGGQFYQTRLDYPIKYLLMIQNRIERKGMIPDSIRNLVRIDEKTEYLRFLVGNVKQEGLLRITLQSGEQVEGLFYKMDENYILLEVEGLNRQIGFREVKTIDYWEDFKIYNWAYRGTYLVMGSLGWLIFDYAARKWQLRSDLRWYFRFSGFASGIMAGFWCDHFVNEFFNPPIRLYYESNRSFPMDKIRVWSRDLMLKLIRFFSKPLLEKEEKNTQQSTSRIPLPDS